MWDVLKVNGNLPIRGHDVDVSYWPAANLEISEFTFPDFLNDINSPFWTISASFWFDSQCRSLVSSMKSAEIRLFWYFDQFLWYFYVSNSHFSSLNLSGQNIFRAAI